MLRVIDDFQLAVETARQAQPLWRETLIETRLLPRRVVILSNEAADLDSTTRFLDDACGIGLLMRGHFGNARVLRTASPDHG